MTISPFQMGKEDSKEEYVYWMHQDICHMMANGEITEKKLAIPTFHQFLREI